MNGKTYLIKYKFDMENGSEFSYDVPINESTLTLENKSNTPQEPPQWTNLDNEKCSNCPLNSSDSPQCPVAFNLHKVVDKFKGLRSFLKTKILVQTPIRSFYKQTDLQTGLISLFGLIMASSACPHFDFMKAMARHHLPFSDSDETLLRVTSFFLLGHFFQDKKDLSYAELLSLLKDNYVKLGIVNQHILKRIRPLVKGDADENAVVGLSMFIQLFEMEDPSKLETLAPLFIHYKNL